jgi:hypothetical protein
MFDEALSLSFFFSLSFLSVNRLVRMMLRGCWRRLDLTIALKSLESRILMVSIATSPNSNKYMHAFCFDPCLPCRAPGESLERLSEDNFVDLGMTAETGSSIALLLLNTMKRRDCALLTSQMYIRHTRLSCSTRSSERKVRQ